MSYIDENEYPKPQKRKRAQQLSESSDEDMTPDDERGILQTRRSQSSNGEEVVRRRQEVRHRVNSYDGGSSDSDTKYIPKRKWVSKLELRIAELKRERDMKVRLRLYERELGYVAQREEENNQRRRKDDALQVKYEARMDRNDARLDRYLSNHT